MRRLDSLYHRRSKAHKSNTLVYHMVGVDVGFENPTFACLEIDYEVCLDWRYSFGIVRGLKL